ncbi:MAG: tetratricopeptide repeat protein, partial [Alphaproteobacteria bacterium]|nr:tetratricopeptide repeat protein [Alphaproteobacteria bacterium]
GEHLNAIEDFKSSIKLSPQNARTHFYRGESNRALGREEAARADFEKAYELDPKLRENEPAQQSDSQQPPTAT